LYLSKQIQEEMNQFDLLKKEKMKLKRDEKLKMKFNDDIVRDNMKYDDCNLRHKKMKKS
jgi:hypothetical protein